MSVMLYVAVVLAFLLAVGVWWMRARGSKTAPTVVKELAQRPASTAPPSAAPAVPSQDDPGATMIYRRAGQASEAASAPRVAVAASSGSSGGQLVALNGFNKGRRFPITALGITIGRNPACDIVLTDNCVSSRHAWIGVTEGKVMLRDLNSTNGTFLNAQLRTSVSEATLRHGDTIFIGGHLGEQFRFEAA